VVALGTPPRVAPVRVRVTTYEAIAYVLAIFVIAIFVMTAATPIITGKWDWGILAVSVIAIALFDTLLRRVIGRASKLAMRITGGVCVVLFVMYAVGVSNSSIIDGHVYLSTSPTAKASASATLIDKDAATLLANDRLLSLTPAEAKASFAEFQPAIDTATAINEKFFSTKANPTLFKAAYTDMGNAAYWESKALTNVLNNLTESGSSSNATESADRVKFLDDTALAQQLAASDAAVFHLKVGKG
jgi:hypothetical protein